METGQLIVLVSALVLGVTFCVLVVLSATRRSKVWPTLAYGVSMMPALLNAKFHGLGLDTFLAVCFFLALTWVILHFAKKEIGDDHGKPL